MNVEISPLEPADEASVEAVLSLQAAAVRVDIPDFPPPCPYDFRGGLTHEVSHRRIERYLAWDEGRVAGYLTLTLPLRDNLDNAEVELTVHPGHRRRGLGRALYQYARDRVRELGRQRATAATIEALPGGPARDDGGRLFATSTGAKSALDEVRSRLDVTTADPAGLAAMLAGARVKAAGYRVVTWHDRTPDEYAADAAYLDGRLVSDAPMGDLDWEPEQVDVPRLREREEHLRACRMRVYSAGAVHEASGRLVALTQLLGLHSSPWHSFQGITLVDPEHRGHRLGALVKTENLALARTHQPELRVIDTWNAAVNRHMISINQEMGFRPVDSWVNWQQEV